MSRSNIKNSLKFDELHPDLVSEIGRQLPRVHLVIAGRDRTDKEQESLKEIENPSKEVNGCSPTELHSLILVSRKLNSLWTPISMQNVSIKTKYLHSFLSLLLNKPQVGNYVQTLRFPGSSNGIDSNEHIQMAIAIKMKAPNHPALPRLPDLGTDSPEQVTISRMNEFYEGVLVGTRALILERCSNLRELSFGSDMTFPLALSGTSKPNLSTEIHSIEMTRLMDQEEFKWNTKQILFMSLLLPNLRRATFQFLLTSKGASFINFHLPALKDTRFSSSIEALVLDVHLEVFPSRKGAIQTTLTMVNFLSMFERLRRLEIKFSASMGPSAGVTLDDESADPFEVEKLPGFRILEGLKVASDKLEHLTVQGMCSDRTVTSKDELQKRASSTRSMIVSLKSLKYLNVEVSFLIHLTTESNPNSLALPDNLEVLQIAFSMGIELPRRTDAAVIKLLLRSKVPNRLRLIILPEDPCSRSMFGLDESAQEELKQNRRKLKEVVMDLGISLKLL